MNWRWADNSKYWKALRLILTGTEEYIAGHQAVVEKFNRQLIHQSIEPRWCRVMESNDRLLAALMVLLAPGHAATLLISPKITNLAAPSQLVQELELLINRAAVDHAAVLQALLPVIDQDFSTILEQTQFRLLAELLYMSAEIPTTVISTPAPISSHQIITYQSSNHDLFADCLQETYINSMDCPGLTSLRDINDVIRTHQATGIFDPSLWWLIHHDTQPVAVLLLTQVPEQPHLEVVYIGVTPRYRRQGWGRVLMQQALVQAQQAQATHLLLAVDSNNIGARKIYDTLGFIVTDRRQAWIRALP